MFDDYKSKIYAIVLISELNNSVSIHFEGFEDLEDAKDFSKHIMDELNIEDINNPKNYTIH
jgi:hypothetical protein